MGIVERADRRVLSAASANTVRLLIGETAATEPFRPPEKVSIAPAKVAAATAKQLAHVRGLKGSGRGRR